MTPTFECEHCGWYTSEKNTGRAKAQADRHERLNGHTTLYLLERDA